MKVIGRAGDVDDRAAELIAFAAEAAVDFVADSSVVKEGFVVFGREDIV